MRVRLMAFALVVVALAGCATTPGPTATCFSKGGAHCDFQPVPGAEGGADGRS